MLIIISALIIGAVLGALSYHHPEVVFCIGGTATVAGMVLLGYMTKYSTILAQSGHGNGSWFSYIAVIYDHMPSGLQAGVFILPAAGILGRLVMWMRHVQVDANAVPETNAQRKARLRGGFDWPGQP